MFDWSNLSLVAIGICLFFTIILYLWLIYEINCNHQKNNDFKIDKELKYLLHINFIFAIMYMVLRILHLILSNCYIWSLLPVPWAMTRLSLYTFFGVRNYLTFLNTAYECNVSRLVTILVVCYVFGIGCCAGYAYFGIRIGNKFDNKCGSNINVYLSICGIIDEIFVSSYVLYMFVKRIYRLGKEQLQQALEMEQFGSIDDVIPKSPSEQLSVKEVFSQGKSLPLIELAMKSVVLCFVSALSGVVIIIIILSIHDDVANGVFFVIDTLINCTCLSLSFKFSDAYYQKYCLFCHRSCRTIKDSDTIRKLSIQVTLKQKLDIEPVVSDDLEDIEPVVSTTSDTSDKKIDIKDLTEI